MKMKEMNKKWKNWILAAGLGMMMTVTACLPGTRSAEEATGSSKT